MMTVDEVLLNFREALNAMVPMAERAGIGWRRIDAYDQWDNIAASLFSGLVEAPLSHLFVEAERERFALPAYDLLVSEMRIGSCDRSVAAGRNARSTLSGVRNSERAIRYL